MGVDSVHPTKHVEKKKKGLVHKEITRKKETEFC